MKLGELVIFPAQAGTVAVNNFEVQQQALARFNRERIAPGVGEEDGYCAILHRQQMELLERDYVRDSRSKLQELLSEVPDDADAFVRWFESLKDRGPGQGDPLFPWLAEEADINQMRWFLQQEVAGEAGFDDLVALTQVKMPDRAKLEMARNYWDEMGRGDPKGMHGPMLSRLAKALGLQPRVETTVAESLALANMMMAMAINRQYAFQSVGALGVIEMTAPGRSAYVVRGLDRLGIPKKESHYFALHAILDVKHSEAWNREVLRPLVSEDARRGKAIAEGALLRLACGAQCFERYRTVLMHSATTESVRQH